MTISASNRHSDQTVRHGGRQRSRNGITVWQALFLSKSKSIIPNGVDVPIRLETMSMSTKAWIGKMIGRLCLGLGASFALVASASAELAMTEAPAIMRAAPSGRAAVVQRLPQRAEIDLEKCDHAWCRASWRGRFGYISEELVVFGSAPATLHGGEMPPPVVYASPTYVTPPAWRWTGPYIGVNGGGVSNTW